MIAERWNHLFALLTFLACAWFGVGTQSEDEFQHVILIAEHLRGHVGAEAMPIDFQAQWRGMLLPVIAAGVFWACELLGITDPFMLTLLLRLITAAFALWVMHGLVRALKPSLRAENHQALDALNWFLWFVPIVLIRFTGETWSALLFARGLTLLLEEKPKNPWAIGAWWGAAVIVRPAAAVLPLAAWLWALLVKKEKRLRLGRMVGGGAIAIVALSALDSLCYGSATLPLWNYFGAALSGQENARFTNLPWYQYALFTVKYATPPLALLLFGALAILLALNRKHPLVLILLSFLLAHSFMPIKEQRFLYPLVPFMPWLLVAAWDSLCTRWPVRMLHPRWMQLLFPFAALNLFVLLIACATPAGNGRIALAKEIRARYGADRVHIDHLGDWRQWIPPFYLAEGSTEALTEKVFPDKNKPIHLVIAPESKDLDRVTNMLRLRAATPSWTHRYLRWYGLEDGYDPLVLYRLDAGVIGH